MKRKACSIAANAMTSFVLYYILLLTTWSKAITAQESSNAKNGVTIMASSKEYLTEHSLYFLLESSIIGSNLNAFSDEIAVQNMRNELAYDYDGEIVKTHCHAIVETYIDLFYDFRKYVEKLLHEI